MSPDPILDVVHLAPPVSVTSPDPITLTLAAPLTAAETPPDPITLTLAWPSESLGAVMSPDPVIERDPVLAVPAVPRLPDPVTERSTAWTPSEPMLRSP